MQGHYRAMVEANRRINLTRITKPAQAAVKHYADSLALMPWLKTVDWEPQTLLDVGTGAGFPAIPLAVARKTWSVTAIDGTGKKIRFLQNTTRELGITNLTPIHARAEHWDTIEQFDVVVSRALAPPARYLKWAGRLVSPGGVIVAHKTANPDEDELREAADAARKLHLEPCDSFAYHLRLGSERLDRLLSIYRKP